MVLTSLSNLINEMCQHWESPVIEDIQRKMDQQLYLAGDIPTSVVKRHFMEPVRSHLPGIWR